MTLTEQQKLAVSIFNGVWCVMASAGSGKTKTFIERISNMLQSGINPRNILAVTYTKKASEEIFSRLEELVGEGRISGLTIGTFHGIAYRLLMSNDNEFNKLKTAPDWWIMQKLNDLCGPKSEKNHLGLNLGLKAGELSSFISYQKSNLVSPTDQFIITDTIGFVRPIPEPLLRKAYVTFEQLKEESRQITFDDMLVRFYKKLQDDATFRADICRQYKYVLVDEFQDTSTLMLKIVEIINSQDIFVVGDWRQSIYAFNNANVDNILDFKDKFAGTTVVELNKNFRSTQNIVNLSNQIIAHSPIEKYKHFQPSESVAGIGDKVVFSAYQNEQEQAQSVVSKIIDLRDSGTPLSKIAILVRTNSQPIPFEEALTDSDIPFDTSKSMSFFDKKEVLDILSYARLVVDSSDDASLRRVYNTPNRYLSKQFMEELERFAGARDMNLLEAMRVTPQAQEWKFKNGIGSITRTIEDLHYQMNINADKFLRNVVKATGYMKHVDEGATSATTLNESKECIERLCNMAARFSTVKDFLNYVSIMADKKKKSKNKDAVNIVTIHSSKGLEWDAVFVPNVHQESLPHKMNPDIEEERRLLYVAASRPHYKLFISWCVYDAESNEKESSIFMRELLGEDKVNSMNAQAKEGIEGYCLIGN